MSNWFTKMCRNAGLFLHNVKNPDDDSKSEKHQVNKTVDEKKVNEKVTLRRTTIDEIEIKKDE